jgi:Ser/Thr protein kinase RdoA (MazF antagonist)
MPGILGRVPDAAAEFSSSAALPILREACQQAGLGSDGAELLRIGENANFQLASAPLVVRISRSADRLPRLTRELCVARWLATAKVPAVRVADEIEQPLVVGGHPVSFWHAVTGGEPTPTHIDLARLLAAYHAAPDCPCDLVTFEPLTTSGSRLTKAEGVDQADLDFLRARCAHLTSEYEHLEFALSRGPIHGDAHTKNLLTDHGQVVLLDFEAAAIGPREWDLMPTSIAVQRYGLPENQYQEFAATYGSARATLRGPVPPTNGQQMINGMITRSGDHAIYLLLLVGVAGFEPAASSSRTTGGAGRLGIVPADAGR